MGTNVLKNLSLVKQRIFQYFDFNSIKKDNFFKETGISSTNFHGSNAKSELGGSNIIKVLSRYSDISPEWLLTGRGDMLRKDEKERNCLTSNAFKSIEIPKHNIQLLKERLAEINHIVSSLETEINSKDQLIEVLTVCIKEFENK